MHIAKLKMRKAREQGYVFLTEIASSLGHVLQLGSSNSSLVSRSYFNWESGNETTVIAARIEDVKQLSSYKAWTESQSTWRTHDIISASFQ